MSYTVVGVTLKQAQFEAGAISTRNSKMPGSSFAISAKHCNVGGKLATVKDSVCNACYALRIQKMRPSVDQGWTSNLVKANGLILRDSARWVSFMVFQIVKASQKTGQPYHRWFDSGDLQSLEMLEAIADICRQTPDIKHWLPTREAKLVRLYQAKHGAFPTNLVVRVSSTMVNDKPLPYANTSTVHNKQGSPQGHVCPASHQGNACGDCRACWTLDVANVSYPKH
jgi:hypothetical protein